MKYYTCGSINIPIKKINNQIEYKIGQLVRIHIDNGLLSLSQYHMSGGWVDFTGKADTNNKVGVIVELKIEEQPYNFYYSGDNVNSYSFSKYVYDVLVENKIYTYEYDELELMSK